MATVEQTTMKVQRILTGPMNLRVMLGQDSFQIRFSDTSTSINIKVYDWGKDKDGEPRTLVGVSSLILREVTPTPALYEWVAKASGTIWFGRIEVIDDAANPGKVSLVLAHVLLGDYLDEKELSSVVWGILSSADQYDDQLKEKFGGKRWADS
jgi:hypothetical protein